MPLTTKASPISKPIHVSEVTGNPSRRFVLTPFGSLGDVLPFIAIGAELRDRGHEVIVITNGAFRDHVESAGLVFVECGTAEEYRETIANPDLFDGLIKGIKLLIHTSGEMVTRLFETIESVWADGNVLVGHYTSYGARIFEEVHGVRAVTLNLAPSSSNFNNIILSIPRL